MGCLIFLSGFLGMHLIAYIKLIKFSSVNVAVAQFTANNTLNSFNKL